MKKIVVLGGGGFIGGHLAKRLKEEGNHVRVCDIKKHEYFFQDEFCHEFILGDLTDPKVVELVIEEGVDEVTISWILKIQTVKNLRRILLILIQSMVGKNYSLKDYIWRLVETIN